MTLTINDTTMISDQNPHAARPPARKGSVLYYSCCFSIGDRAGAQRGA
jgi:hypothetical protein